MRKKFLSVFAFTAILIVFNLILLVFASCLKADFPGTIVKNDPPDVAIAWIGMQQKLFVGTPGLLPHVTGRSYAYIGLTMYEAIAPGMDFYQSIASQLNGELALPYI